MDIQYFDNDFIQWKDLISNYTNYNFQYKIYLKGGFVIVLEILQQFFKKYNGIDMDMFKNVVKLFHDIDFELICTDQQYIKNAINFAVSSGFKEEGNKLLVIRSNHNSDQPNYFEMNIAQNHYNELPMSSMNIRLFDTNIPNVFDLIYAFYMYPILKEQCVLTIINNNIRLLLIQIAFNLENGMYPVHNFGVSQIHNIINFVSSSIRESYLIYNTLKYPVRVIRFITKNIPKSIIIKNIFDIWYIDYPSWLLLDTDKLLSHINKISYIIHDEIDKVWNNETNQNDIFIKIDNFLKPINLTGMIGTIQYKRITKEEMKLIKFLLPTNIKNIDSNLTFSSNIYYNFCKASKEFLIED
jgi:hypothetical protein